MSSRADPSGNLDPATQAEWVDAVADRFEAAWKAGPPPRIADFLGTATGTGRAALLVELVKIDLEYRRRAGADRRVEDYLPEYPELRGPDQALPDDLVRHAWRLRAGADGPAEARAAETPPAPGRPDE